MKKVNGIILGTLISATLLGVFPQSLAYFMTENIFKTFPVYYLTAFTIVSILLFVFSFGTAFLANKNKRIKLTLKITLLELF